MASCLARAARSIARLTLGVLLFAQLALGLQACMMPAMAHAAALSSDAMPERCGVVSRNACLAQWTVGDRASATPQTLDDAAPPQHPLGPPTPACVALVQGLDRSGMDRQTDPPSCIRYCRYLE